MKKSEVIRAILGERLNNAPLDPPVKAFAPTNIALCKYWGKRDAELNLPVTSSLSLSLGKKGATTELSISNRPEDSVILNDQPVNPFSNFAKRLRDFLQLFRVDPTLFFHLRIKTNVPIAAGLASSASGFASVVMALNKLFDWELKAHELSILARLGSGSASRSIWRGFVEWQVGTREDGMDSYGAMLPNVWPSLCIGLMVLNKNEKKISSRDAMQRTVNTSMLYTAWPEQVTQDLLALREAIRLQDFQLLGKTAESNALAMHATMLAAWPPISYCLPETMAAIQKIWDLRHDGLSIYFTQDAGPNLKLLFLQKDAVLMQTHFPELEIISPFGES